MNVRDGFGGVYTGIRVLITGHTGFKGSWLNLWLKALGAETAGYSLAPPSSPSHYALAGGGALELGGDVRDGLALAKAVREYKPRVVFHLAAQALVRESYAKPAETYATNIMGTVNMLEACRAVPSVRAVLLVTSDKCYANHERNRAYRENDRLGGSDPYSGSKACCELVAESYRQAFFQGNGPLLATARAGNVLGGGDWGRDRLLPDLLRAAEAGQTSVLRHPSAIRPWQHVLEPLSGYLLLGAGLLQGRRDLAAAWNFGPDLEDMWTVERVAARAARHWSRIRYRVESPPDAPKESHILRLNSDKARAVLGWRPVWNLETCLEKTVAWHVRWNDGGEIQSRAQIEDYVADAALPAGEIPAQTKHDGDHV